MKFNSEDFISTCNTQSSQMTILSHEFHESNSEALNTTSICSNCKRRNNEDSQHDLMFIRHERKEIIRRQKFRHVSCGNDNERIILCKECSMYLTNKNGRLYQYMWPSFFWTLFVDKEVMEKYEQIAWRFVPLTWRKWWLLSLRDLDMYSNISVNFPPPYFKDHTENIRNFNNVMKKGNLTRIAETCNQLLYPIILCPWGCSEYIHRCGEICIDIMIQRFLPLCHITMINDVLECRRCVSCRDDYIRKSISKYETLLLNPRWVVFPSVAMNKGPYILTCMSHNSGTLRKYLHIPRYPFEHNLPSKFGDQLSHAVINPRSIKPMKKSKYSNSYQMHEQRGCFQGIDTCSISCVGNFSYWSILLNESESLTLAHRADILSLLGKLQKEKKISSNVHKEMIENSRQVMKQFDGIDEYCHGATFVTLSDALSLQRQVGEENLIEISNNNGNMIKCKRNWIQKVIFCQKYDKDRYGAQFPYMSKLYSSQFDTRILWCLCTMIVYIPDIWVNVEKAIKKKDCLNGWVLTFLTKVCFPEVVMRTDSRCPFKYSLVNTIAKFTEKVYSLKENFFDEDDIREIFIDCPDILICSMMEFDILETNVNEKEIIILYNDWSYRNNEELLTDSPLEVNNNFYELRYIAMTENINNDKWTGMIYMRHGTFFKGWWKLIREKKCNK